MSKKYFEPYSEDGASTSLTWFIGLVAVAGAAVAGLALFVTYQDRARDNPTYMCQHRRGWLQAAKARDEAIVACVKRYENELKSPQVIAKLCDDQVTRTHYSSGEIIMRLKASSKYAGQCGIQE